MILSKKVIFTSIIAAIAVVTIFAIQVISSYINSTSDTTQLEKGSMSIVFTREEMRRVSFGVVERFADRKSVV